MITKDPIAETVIFVPEDAQGLAKVLYVPDQDRLNALRLMPGVVQRTRWNNKGLFVPLSIINQGRLPKEFCDFPEDTNELAPSGLRLKRYQRRCISMLRNVTRATEGAILAAEAGTGKTVMSLQALSLNGHLSNRGLIIGPNMAKYIWTRGDPKRHFGMTVAPLEGTKDLDRTIFNNRHLFCSYEILDAWDYWITSEFKPEWLIIDEIHLLDGYNTKRYTAAHNIALSATVAVRYGLTGTPVNDALMDLWPQLTIVQPRQWGSRFAFGLRFCDGRQDDSGHWQYQGYTNQGELNARLAGTYIRLLTEDTSDELPGIERSSVDVELNPEDAAVQDYSLAQINLRRYLKEKGKLENIRVQIGTRFTDNVSVKEQKKGAAQLVTISTLIGILGEIKKWPAVKLAVDLTFKHDKLVIFVWRRETCRWITDELKRLLPHVSVLGPTDGSMPFEQRASLADTFAASKNKSIIVATVQAVGACINSLSAASAGIIVDLFWNTMWLRQAEKRLQREGCPHAKVEIYYMRAKNTVDDLFIKHLVNKATLGQKVSTRDSDAMLLVEDLAPDKCDWNMDLDTLCNEFLRDMK